MLNSIYFDEFGNVFLKNNDKLFEININNKNELELNETNLKYEIINIKKEKLKLVNDPTSLKSRVIKKMREKKEEDGEDDNLNYNSDDEYHNNMNDDETKYYKEDEDYYLDDNDNIENSDNSLNTSEQFKYISETDKINIIRFISDDDENQNDNIDYNSLYETFIYDGTEDLAKLVFVSKIENSVPIYRMLIYSDTNTIHFRPIGSKNKKFKLSYNNDDIIINLIKE